MRPPMTTSLNPSFRLFFVVVVVAAGMEKLVAHLLGKGFFEFQRQRFSCGLNAGFGALFGPGSRSATAPLVCSARKL